MKPVENPAVFLYRADVKPPVTPNSERKKPTSKSFLSLFRSDIEADASPKSLEDGLGPDRANLEKQIDEIHEIGQKLLKQQTLEQVKAYKAAIKSFIQYFLKNGIAADELVSNRNIMNQKKYTIVRIIDEKLERLVTGILQSQAKQMEILSKLEEIQGLLVNLIH